MSRYICLSDCLHLAGRLFGLIHFYMADGDSNRRDYISNNHIFIVVALVILLKRMSLYILFSIENETVSH